MIKLERLRLQIICVLLIVYEENIAPNFGQFNQIDNVKHDMWIAAGRF
jgi:hypothetical protein